VWRRAWLTTRSLSRDLRERKVRLTRRRGDRHHLFVNGQAASTAALHQEQAIPAGPNGERAGQRAPRVCGQIELLQRCPHERLPEPPDADAAREPEQDHAHEPDRHGALPFPGFWRATPFVSHGCLRVVVLSRASACWCLSWSARSIRPRMVSAVTGAPLQTWNEGSAGWSGAPTARQARSSQPVKRPPISGGRRAPIH